ncbi:hypothetical protein Tco_0487523 [Tanacetum coccineum]
MMSEDSSAAGTTLTTSSTPADDEVLEDYTIPYDQYLATKDSQDVPTKASPDPPSAIPPSAAYMLNTLSELTTQLKQETESLKTTLRNKEATIAHLTCETKTVLSEKKTLEDKYLEEIVCLKSANQVATGSFDKNALETEISQLKDNISSLRIQNDGYKIEIAKQNRRYLELSKASTHSRNTSTEKLAALHDEIAQK